MEEELTGLFRAVTTQFRARLQGLPIQSELNLPSFQARLFGGISRNPGVTQLGLATATGRDKAQVARAIAGLESRELVRRSPHETDWRAYGLYLTEKGQRIAAIGERQRQELIGHAFAALDQSEREALRESLRKIVVNLTADEE